MISKFIRAAVLATTLLGSTAVGLADDQKPTVVLVHGAFADTSSWDKVDALLAAKGYKIISFANPLRGVASDSAYATQLVDQIAGPVVLVGHSYGGEVISNVQPKTANVKALVYVAAFSPDIGESAASLSGRFPGGTLGEALAKPVALADGEQDLYIDQSKFHDQFAKDVPEEQARLMAIGQRPITAAALGEPAKHALWKSIPSWHIYGSADRNITADAMKFMAERAKSRDTVEVEGASHVVMISNPAKVADLIEEAAEAK
ncbi:alpha/beta hydrolase [Rhizobiaceae bacterium n36]|uniref:Alpha/beta hydrolase n=1 Tax=Ferirhizobium litorale TaxID=2927786 RepID=A0AAE3U3H9_9HYPH|nr:alpha/beta hydrolase [Fererhizobium litorale]MDI7924671.1 alpha/beta hydrolase [Fererhizobium litorale]